MTLERLTTRTNVQMSDNLNYKAMIGKKRQKGYCAMRRGHSCVLGMKTQCMRTKSSTAGSDRIKGKRQEKRREESGKRKSYKASNVQSKILETHIRVSRISSVHSTGTWFTGMYVYSHGLQEMLKNLLWCP